MRVSIFDGVLDDLDLHRYSRQHGFFQSVELVKTSPGTTFYQSDENTSHRFHIDTLSIYKSILTVCQCLRVGKNLHFTHSRTLRKDRILTSSQLNTSTCRPKRPPRALTDSVFPVPAGPYGFPPIPIAIATQIQ